MKTLRHIVIGLLMMVPVAIGAPKLAPGDAHAYRIHIESSKKIDLGMGMTRHEAVTFDGTFDILVQEITAGGARIRLTWRELTATPTGAVAGQPVDDATTAAWTDACATLKDQHLHGFVTAKGLISIEGLSALNPPRTAITTFDRLFSERDLVAIMGAVFTPTGAQAGASGVGLIACNVSASDVAMEEADALSGTANIVLPDDLQALPGLDNRTGEAAGTIIIDTDTGWITKRTLEAKGTVSGDTGPIKARIEAKSTMVLERLELPNQ